MQIPDPDVRRSALGKYQRATRLASELQGEIHGWWEHHPPRLQLEKGSERVANVVLVADPLPPISEWSLIVADILQNFRSALDRLTKSVGFIYAGFGKWDGHFPIHDAEEGWAQWLPYLAVLRDLNNLEKHDIGLSMAATLSALTIGGGTFTVEGVLDDEALAREITAAYGEPPVLETKRRVIASMTMPGRILTMPDEVDIRPDFTISPVVEVGSDQVSLQDLMSSIGHEVVWAISYLVGRESSATVPPTNFDL